MITHYVLNCCENKIFIDWNVYDKVMCKYVTGLNNFCQTTYFRITQSNNVLHNISFIKHYKDGSFRYAEFPSEIKHGNKKCSYNWCEDKNTSSTCIPLIKTYQQYFNYWDFNKNYVQKMLWLEVQINTFQRTVRFQCKDILWK